MARVLAKVAGYVLFLVLLFQVTGYLSRPIRELNPYYHVGQVLDHVSRSLDRHSR